MFSMEDIGKKISELRKKQNLTQLELADKMGISFQAVSNWERGTSMPDISKLPELAELFDVTIDYLLGEHLKVIDKSINDNTQIGLNDDLISIDEIEDLFPFLGTNITNDLAVKAANNGKYKELALIAPFASKELIGNLALKLYEESGIAAVNDIVPFIPKHQILEIAEKEYMNNGFQNFDSIAPLLNRSYLSELAQKEIRKHGIKSISNIAPFLDKHMLSEFIKEQYLE